MELLCRALTALLMIARELEQARLVLFTMLTVLSLVDA